MFTDKPALKLAIEAGIEPFHPLHGATRAGSRAALIHLAQTMLAGRNDRYEEETKIHGEHIRVHEIDLFASRFLLGIVESYEMPGAEARNHRVILFRADGEVWHQSPEGARQSRHEASVDLRYQGAVSDARKVLEATIKGLLKKRQTECKQMERALERLHSLPPP
jgi:hypothetical protein